MFEDFFLSREKILGECAIAEPLRRIEGVELHATLFNSPLIYGPELSREAMRRMYRRYLEIAEEAGLPLLLTAPTWRLDAERVRGADVPETINRDAVDFLIGVRDEFASSQPVYVGALLGPKNDCYRPEEALPEREAADFHAAQIEELAGTDGDFLLGQTLPAVSEAWGMARALAMQEKPYFISFCTGVDGLVLDGASLPEAFARIDGDEEVVRRPLGYFVNCTHPGFHFDRYERGDLERLCGIQANGSSRDVRLLESATGTVADSVEEWTFAMKRFHEKFEVAVLGGCCGTNERHLQALARVAFGAG